MFENMALIWIAVAIVFAVLEGFTVSLVTVWFAVGGVVSMIASLLGANLPVQIAIFFAVSIILLIFTRPILVKHLKLGKEKNNLDQIIGKVALVTSDIEPFNSGHVKLNGIIWTAIAAEQDKSYAIGERVKVTKIEGVKLIVTSEEKQEEPQ